jgi:Protein of unknown function (DUF3810)
MKERFLRPVLMTSLILLASAILLLYALPEGFNQLIFRETSYPITRIILNVLFSKLPIPGFWVIIVFTSGIIIFALWQMLWKHSRKKGAFLVINTFVLIPAAFFWFWGLHYGIRETSFNSIIVSEKIAVEDVRATIQKCISTRALFCKNQDAISPIWPAEIQQQMERNSIHWVRNTLSENNLPHQHPASRMQYWPEGFLLRWGISGMYFPFSGEPTVDKGLHAIRVPHTILHEWAHSYGYTGEGDCNLIGYLASMESQDPFIRYSAYMERLKDELFLMAITDYEIYQTIKNEMPEALKRDFQSIRKHHRKFKGILSDTGEWMNDRYLKSMGIEDGTDNYYKWVLKLKQMEKLKNDKVY